MLERETETASGLCEIKESNLRKSFSALKSLWVLYLQDNNTFKMEACERFLGKLNVNKDVRL